MKSLAVVLVNTYTGRLQEGCPVRKSFNKNDDNFGKKKYFNTLSFNYTYFSKRIRSLKGYFSWQWYNNVIQAYADLGERKKKLQVLYRWSKLMDNQPTSFSIFNLSNPLFNNNIQSMRYHDQHQLKKKNKSKVHNISSITWISNLKSFCFVDSIFYFWMCTNLTSPKINNIDLQKDNFRNCTV